MPPAPIFTVVPPATDKPPASPRPTYRRGLGRLLPGLTVIRNQPFWQVALTALAGSVLINAGFWLVGWAGTGDWSGESLSYLGLGISIAFAMWLSMSYTNAYISARFDWLGQPWRSFLLAFVLNIVVAVVVLATMYFLFFVGFRGETPADWLARQRFGDYFASVLIGLLITAIYQGAYFVKLWKASVTETEALKTATVSAKYEALNAQINPHFLFNSLNVLSALVKTDPARAEDFIQGLSTVYRYVLEVKGEQLVPLDRELAAARAYAALVGMRFGAERLRIDFDLEPRPGEQVVPLALQMLLENAVKHNGATRRSPLHVRLTREGAEIVVRNNRVPLFEPAERRGIGLDNIRERYRLATGKDVRVVSGAEGFEVALPIGQTLAP